MEFIGFAGFYLVLFFFYTVMESLGAFIHLLLDHNLTVMENQMFESARFQMLMALICTYLIYNTQWEWNKNLSFPQKRYFFLFSAHLLGLGLFFHPQWEPSRFYLLPVSDYLLIPLWNICLIFIPLQVLQKMKTRFSQGISAVLSVFLLQLILKHAQEIHPIWFYYHFFILGVLFKKEKNNALFQFFYLLINVGIPSLFLGMDALNGSLQSLLKLGTMPPLLGICVFLCLFTLLYQKYFLEIKEKGVGLL